MQLLVLVGVGGAIGALGRLGIDQALAFTPWATLLVNVLGCLLIGAAVPLLIGRAPWLHPFVVTGILGGFTTMSAFAADTVVLLVAEQRGWALGYVAATLTAGLLAVPVGARLVGQR